MACIGLFAAAPAADWYKELLYAVFISLVPKGESR